MHAWISMWIGYNTATEIDIQGRIPICTTPTIQKNKEKPDRKLVRDWIFERANKFKSE